MNKLKIGDGNRLYIAYGSNLNLEQMARRCPYSIPIGAAELEGYRLLFRGSKDSSVATVEPEDGCSVPVLVWEITPRCEEALDYYEGWPRLYRKETVTISFQGKPLEVMVYIMNRGRPMGSPGGFYLNAIAEGYYSAGFDKAILDEAVEFSVCSAKPERRGDCFLCSNSMSVEDQFEYGADRLFCVIKQEYVNESDCCEDFN